MSLANKHRPQTFEQVIGQSHITDILRQQITQEKTSNHNYLLFGPRGTGKTTCARILSKAINCLDLKDGEPCNECQNCQTINRSSSLDYIEIDAASHTGVDNIREEILDKVLYPPTQLKKKIYVIDEVHMLSKGAFNALLKTIEEPKPNVCFILATTEIHKVPDTIISRCQVYNYKKITTDDMTKHLEDICTKENINFTEKALRIISKYSEGCARDAVKYVDQVSILGEINEENITKFLGVASDYIIEEFINTLKKQDKNLIFQQIETLQEQGVDLYQFAKQSLLWIDQNLRNDIDYLLKVAESFSEIISTIKYYPYPAIVYKISFNKLLNQDKNIEGSQRLTEGNSTSLEKILIEETKIVMPILEVPVAVITNEQETPIISPVIEQQIVTSLGNLNVDNLLPKLIELIDKPSLKNSIKEHIIIDDIDDNRVRIIVINIMTNMLFQKQEHASYLEDILSKVFGKPMKAEFVFEKKEDYFNRKLGF